MCFSKVILSVIVTQKSSTKSLGSVILRHKNGTTRYYETVQEVLQETKSRGTKYYVITWHCKNDEVIQNKYFVEHG